MTTFFVVVPALVLLVFGARIVFRALLFVGACFDALDRL